MLNRMDKIIRLRVGWIKQTYSKWVSIFQAKIFRSKCER